MSHHSLAGSIDISITQHADADLGLRSSESYPPSLLDFGGLRLSCIVIHEDTKHGSIAISAISNRREHSTDYSTHAAVDAKISALLALVSKPTTAAKRHVKSTIIPIRKLVFWGSMLTKHTIAPMSNTALRKIEITAPAR